MFCISFLSRCIMAKWNVWVPYHCTVRVQVEADTEEQARELGELEAYPYLCHQCADDIEMGEANPDFESEAVQVKNYTLKGDDNG
jgi:hypothetical protein